MAEVWKQIPGWPYKVSSQARIRRDRDPYLGRVLMADCIRHGRIANGERQHLAKLTTAKVLIIRRLLVRGRTKVSLAKLFGVSVTTVWQIAFRKTWKHI